MKKLVVLTAFLSATVTANQAVACDMGAIETWVAAACQRDGCETKSTTKNSAEGCDGSNCTALYSVARPELSRRLTANDSFQASNQSYQTAATSNPLRFSKVGASYSTAQLDLDHHACGGLAWSSEPW